MKFFKRTEKEVEKWLHSINNNKDKGKGFFRYEDFESEINVDGKTFLKKEKILKYYKIIKQPTMGSFKENNKHENKIFESMLENNEIDVAESYISTSLSYEESEIDNNILVKLINDINKNSEIKVYSNPRLIHGAAYYGMSKREFLHELSTFLTPKWGFFDKTASLDEQEDFVKHIIEQNVEDTNNFNILNDNSDSYYLSNIFRVLKSKGSKLTYL